MKLSKMTIWMVLELLLRLTETLRMCLGDLWKPYRDILISDRYVQAGESYEALNMAIFTM